MFKKPWLAKSCSTICIQKQNHNKQSALVNNKILNEIFISKGQNRKSNTKLHLYSTECVLVISDSSLKTNSFVWSRRLYIYRVFSIFFPHDLLISNPLFLWLIIPSSHQETIPAFKPLSIKCFHMEGWGYCWHPRMLAIRHYKSKHKWHLVIKVLILLAWLMSMKTQNTLWQEHVCAYALSVPYCISRVKSNGCH